MAEVKAGTAAQTKKYILKDATERAKSRASSGEEYNNKLKE